MNIFHVSIKKTYRIILASGCKNVNNKNKYKKKERQQNKSNFRNDTDKMDYGHRTIETQNI